MNEIKKKAVTALLIDERGMILSVSRKNDFMDVGLPGGKVEPGESLEEALIRELKEETGLTAIDFFPLFSGIDGEFICLTFLIQSYVGNLDTPEAGKIKWVYFNELISGCFNRYNSMLQMHLINTADFPKPYSRAAAIQLQ